MFTIVAIVLLSITLGVLVLLIIPMELIFDVEYGDTRRNDLAFRWLFGAVNVPLGKRSRKDRKPKAKRKRESEQEKPKQKKRKGRQKAWALLRNRALRTRAFRYLRRVMRSVKFKTLGLRVRIGLDDPADTGRLWGILGPVDSLVSNIASANIHIEPDFTKQMFLLESHGQIRVIPLRILGLGLLFFLSPTVIRAIVFEP